MATLDQVIAQIRFQLDQLSTRNAHHEFEHLCRHLTRARICSNILPATGPVAAGGDQGRDFETFRTYLSGTSIADSVFIGLASQKPIAFACSLEKGNRISAKIKSDLKTIMSSGSDMEAVHYFCASDLPVAKRHKLQTWALTTFSVKLEIHDGQSISELLADRDVFWIAERYLQIPGEIFPRSSSEDGKGWYQEFLTRCRQSPPPLTNANFSDIRLAGRHALSTPELNQDLPFWIGLLKQYISSGLPGNLNRRAVYEASVLSIRGLGSLEGYEDDIKWYFTAVPQMEEPADFEDASVILNFCAYACSQNSCLLTMDELRRWWQMLVDRADKLLATVSTPNKKACLLDARGSLSIFALSPNPPSKQIEEAFEWWIKLADAVEDAPLFPLEAFADRLTKLIPIFEEELAYYELTQRVDVLLSKRFGSFIAAEKCRDRALALYDNGKLLPAINQLHQSKINWFTAETLGQSMLAMLFIAQCYQQLGLCLAAKYYALGVASIALHSQDNDLKPFVPRALLSAAQYDYSQGAWCSFLETVDIGLLNHLHFAEDALDISTHPSMQRVVMCVAWVKLLTGKIAPHFLPLIDTSISRWDMQSLIEDLTEESQAAWGDGNGNADGWDIAERSLYGVPFGDSGPERELAWSELGITWKVRWPNDYDTTPSAEGLVALLQIFLAELAGVDLCLMCTEVTIDFAVSSDSQISVVNVPSKVGRSWTVRLPVTQLFEKAEIERSQRNFIFAATAILADLSLAPEETLTTALTNCFRDGIASKLFVGQQYELLYKEYVRRDAFEATGRDTLAQPVPPHAFKIKETRWVDGPGPGYSKEESERWLKNRYESFIIPVRETWRRLTSDQSFVAISQRLRADGWLDWHVLSAVHGITLNFRINSDARAPQDPEGIQRLFGELMRRPEMPDDIPIPLSLFTEERMREQIIYTMLSTLKAMGLVCRQKIPDITAIDHFLRHRYNYWSDDIEHDLNHQTPSN